MKNIKWLWWVVGICSASVFVSIISTTSQPNKQPSVSIPVTKEQTTSTSTLTLETSNDKICKDYYGIASIWDGNSDASVGIKCECLTGYYFNAKNEQCVISSSTNNSSVNWSMISQTDQSRMKEIMVGVMQNTVAVTPEIKQELFSIFRKYNLTDKEIEDFGMYGPAMAVNYQRVFFDDALLSLRSGTSVKSKERSDYESELLKRGLITKERLQKNDADMYAIANSQPMIGSVSVLTIDDINQTINNINTIGARFQSLFSR